MEMQAKQLCKIIQRLNIYLSHNPSILLLAIYPKKKTKHMSLQKYVHTCSQLLYSERTKIHCQVFITGEVKTLFHKDLYQLVHGRFNRNSSKVKITQIYFKRMNCGTFISWNTSQQQKEQTTNTSNNVEKFQKHYTEQKNQIQKSTYCMIPFI